MTTEQTSGPVTKAPVPGYSFYVEIDGMIEASFTSCTGLSSRREVMPHQEGGLNDYVHSLPGRITHSNITLKQGISFSDELWKWYIDPEATGFVNYRTISIFQCVPYTDTVVRIYNLTNAFPVAWTGPDLDTSSNQIAIESLEIAFAQLRILLEPPNNV